MNEKNLIRPEDLTPSERRESARRAGKASAEARRRKKNLKAAMKELLSMDITDTKIYNSTAELGIEVGELNYQAAIVAAMVKKAAGGDVAAFKEIRSLIGEDNDAERVKLQKKQVALQEKKLGGSDEGLPDDGFLAALNGSARGDWNDED